MVFASAGCCYGRGRSYAFTGPMRFRCRSDAPAEIDGGDVLTGFTLDLRLIWQTTL